MDAGLVGLLVSLALVAGIFIGLGMKDHVLRG